MTDLPPPNDKPALPAPDAEILPPATHNADPHARWRFIRDVGVFQLKLFLNNIHNFVQIPITLVIAAIDLIFKGAYDGERFYKTLEYGRAIDDAIDIYSVIGHREKPLNTEYTVDALVARLETVVVREYEKGGTAASVRAALDRALDHVQEHAGKGKENVEDAIRRMKDKINPDDSTK